MGDGLAAVDLTCVGADTRRRFVEDQGEVDDSG
jgi:hypothetical protein